MLFLALLLMTSAFLRTLVLLMTSAKWGTLGPDFCLQLLPEKAAHAKAMGSLLCGEKVTDPALLDSLRQTSLLHLFVVSGSHLIALELSLQFLKIPRPVRRGIAAGFVVLTGFQAPLVRAFVGLCLPGEGSRWGPRGRPDLDVMKAGLLTLALLPAWITSLSLALSWLAALALSLPWGEGWRGAFRRSIAIWVFLAPALAGAGVPSPLSWLVNLFVAPVFSLLSLPLAVVALPGGRFTLPFDLFMDGFFALLAGLAGLSPPPGQMRFPEPVALWLWIGFLHVTIHAALLFRARSR